MKQIILFSILFLAACSAKPMSINFHLFEHSDCIQECWNNLRIGETTESELQAFLETNGYIILSNQAFTNGFSIIIEHLALHLLY